MVIKLPLMEQNGMIGMVQLNQVLQCAGGFFGRVLEVVDFWGGNFEL